MRFRFGWKKEQKGDSLVKKMLEDELYASGPEPGFDGGSGPGGEYTASPSGTGLDSPIRILAFGDKDPGGNLHTLFLRSKGYEVHHFPAPATCALIAREACACPRDHVCADLFLIDIEMEGMTGIELIRHQNERGCRAPARNKAILAADFTHRQEYDIRSLGCIPMRKPFRLKDLLSLVETVENAIPADRKLTPQSELFTAPQR